eukprot:Nk52_evm33s152 gene=Nk52_evmTU33s152
MHEQKEEDEKEGKGDMGEEGGSGAEAVTDTDDKIMIINENAQYASGLLFASEEEEEEEGKNGKEEEYAEGWEREINERRACKGSSAEEHNLDTVKIYDQSTHDSIDIGNKAHVDNNNNSHQQPDSGKKKRKNNNHKLVVEKEMPEPKTQSEGAHGRGKMGIGLAIPRVEKKEGWEERKNHLEKKIKKQKSKNCSKGNNNREKENNAGRGKGIVKMKPVRMEAVTNRVIPSGYAERHRMATVLNHQCLSKQDARGQNGGNKMQGDTDVTITDGPCEGIQETRPTNRQASFSNDSNNDTMLSEVSQQNVSKEFGAAAGHYQGQQGFQSTSNALYGSNMASRMMGRSEMLQQRREKLKRSVFNSNRKRNGSCIHLKEHQEDIQSGKGGNSVDTKEEYSLPPLLQERFAASKQEGKGAMSNNYDAKTSHIPYESEYEEYMKIIKSGRTAANAGGYQNHESRKAKTQAQSSLEAVRQGLVTEMDYARREQFLNEEVARSRRKKNPFSKPRSIDFSPYTVRDYRLLQFNSKNKLGGLGPNVNNDDYVEKLSRWVKQKEYAKQVRSLHSNFIPAPVGGNIRNGNSTGRGADGKDNEAKIKREMISKYSESVRKANMIQSQMALKSKSQVDIHFKDSIRNEHHKGKRNSKSSGKIKGKHSPLNQNGHDEDQMKLPGIVEQSGSNSNRNYPKNDNATEPRAITPGFYHRLIVQQNSRGRSNDPFRHHQNHSVPVNHRANHVDEDERPYRDIGKLLNRRKAYSMHQRKDSHYISQQRTDNYTSDSDSNNDPDISLHRPDLGSSGGSSDTQSAENLLKMLEVRHREEQVKVAQLLHS